MNTETTTIFKIALVCFLSIALNSCMNENSPLDTDDFQFKPWSFIDIRDSIEYRCVKIGDQIWMAENLAVKATSISTSSKTAIDGDTALIDCSKTEAYVWSNTADSLGRLYSWEGAMLACPTGWHLPSDEEWNELELFLGMPEAQSESIGWRGTDEGAMLKSTLGWLYNGNGNDPYGFSALPSGLINNSGTRFDQGFHGIWWSSTVFGNSQAYYRSLCSDSTKVDRRSFYRSFGFSVRCLRDQ